MFQPKALSQTGSRDENDEKKAQHFVSPSRGTPLTSFRLMDNRLSEMSSGDVFDKLGSPFAYKPQQEWGITFPSQEELKQGKYVHLFGLDLRRNGFRKLALELFNFRSLSILLLRNNNITQIPADISHLLNLQIIDISYNQLDSIPKEIGRLSKLRELHLEENFLKSLPLQIGCLLQLRILSLEGNPLEGDLCSLVGRQATAQEIVMHFRNSLGKL